MCPRPKRTICRTCVSFSFLWYILRLLFRMFGALELAARRGPRRSRRRDLKSCVLTGAERTPAPSRRPGRAAAAGRGLGGPRLAGERCAGMSVTTCKQQRRQHILSKLTRRENVRHWQCSLQRETRWLVGQHCGHPAGAQRLRRDRGSSGIRHCAAWRCKLPGGEPASAYRVTTSTRPSPPIPENDSVVFFFCLQRTSVHYSE